VVTVTATATDGSEVEGSVEITISGQNTGLNKVETQSIVFYPNPVKQTLTIEQAGALSAIEILDVNGKQLIHITDISDRISLDVSDYANGIYFIRTLRGDEVSTYKFVK